MVIHGIGKQYFGAISFFDEKLNLPSDIIIHFSYSRNLGENVLGYCWESVDSIFSKAPIYCVKLKTKQDKKTLLETIAHEMCHIKQYVNHEITASLNTWRGVPVKGEPWEIEAEDFAISICKELEEYGR